MCEPRQQKRANRNVNENIPGSDMVFCGTACFQAAAPHSAGTSDIVRVGTMRRFDGGEVMYALFEIL